MDNQPTTYTRKEWIDTLPPDVRYKTYAAMRKQRKMNRLSDQCDTLHDAIGSAFDWGDTVEKTKYWFGIANGVQTIPGQKKSKSLSRYDLITMVRAGYLARDYAPGLESARRHAESIVDAYINN